MNDQTIDLTWLDAESSQYNEARAEWTRCTTIIDNLKAANGELKELLADIEAQAVVNGEAVGANEKARQASLDAFMAQSQAAAKIRNELRAGVQRLDRHVMLAADAERSMKLHMARIAFGEGWLRKEVTVTGPVSWPKIEVAMTAPYYNYGSGGGGPVLPPFVVPAAGATGYKHTPAEADLFLYEEASEPVVATEKAVDAIIARRSNPAYYKDPTKPDGLFG